MSDRTNMADKSLEDTIKSNLAAKRSNRRPYKRIYHFIYSKPRAIG